MIKDPTTPPATAPASLPLLSLPFLLKALLSLSRASVSGTVVVVVVVMVVVGVVVVVVVVEVVVVRSGKNVKRIFFHLNFILNLQDSAYTKVVLHDNRTVLSPHQTSILRSKD